MRRARATRRKTEDIERKPIFVRPRAEDRDLWERAAKAKDLSLNKWIIKVANEAARKHQQVVLDDQPALQDLLETLRSRGFGESEERELLMAADQVLPEGRAATRKLLPDEVAALRRRWAKIDGLRKQRKASRAEV